MQESASTVVYAVSARSAVVHQSASTVVSGLRCKECGGSAFCEHGRLRSQCKECGGSSICEHGRIRSECKECGGSQICEHGRVALSSARSAVGHQSASTVVCALSARSARSSECIINQITTSQSILVFTHSSRTHPPNKSPAVRVNLLVHVELGGFLVTPVQVPLILRRRYHLRPCACTLDLGQHRSLQVRLRL